ncbi:CPBP family intramembrane glutamic endopeptidase [Mucilaginibacter sp. BT774]|uniref:CPBP family intramembrane glutamic endopeptidase n=1 Tax=Mucilaginibacter sp. BT774 TaxID=3062276 RepID=UPI002676CBC7|nr:type II CAAX endopeptidase family protein [Mucilaginibacter sp. BT774]MDO3624638.1 type II CAAX endopeptidase family protein [Mucilaginibacter sp. BT774]
MDNPGLTYPNKPTNIILFAGVALTLVLLIFFDISLSHLQMDYYDKLFYSRFVYWGIAVILLFYSLKVERQPLLWKEENNTIGFILLSVLVLYVLTITASIVSAIPALFGERENNTMMKKVIEIINGHQAMIFFIALTAGATEEVIFRGYVLTRLSQLLKNNAAAIIVSSLLFAALHYKYGSLRELIFTFLIGVLFSIYYIRYHNIKAIIVTHFLIDYINMNIATHLKLK